MNKHTPPSHQELWCRSQYILNYNVMHLSVSCLTYHALGRRGDRVGIRQLETTFAPYLGRSCESNHHIDLLAIAVCRSLELGRNRLSSSFTIHSTYRWLSRCPRQIKEYLCIWVAQTGCMSSNSCFGLYGAALAYGASGLLTGGPWHVTGLLLQYGQHSGMHP